MSDITNSADVIDVRDIIERVKELEGQRTEKYVAGFNMPGYMPDSEPAEFDDSDDARSYIAEELRRSAETEEENAEELEAAAEALERLSSEKAGAEWGQTVGQFHYWISYEGETGGLDSEEAEELETLTGLLKELAGNGGDEQWRGDWYPVTLIRDSYFEEAMDEMLEECGDLPKDLPCYLTIAVDYKALQMDYSSVEYDGVTYWYR